MLDRIRPRLSFANVTSALALFVALGGVGYAAAVLPKNSVGPKQIRKGAVRTSELRARAVTLGKISPRARAALKGSRATGGSQGPAGPTGARGPTGPRGLAGAPATKLFAVVSSTGTLRRGSGAASAERIAEGTYRVTFNADLTNCVPLANVGEDGPSPRPASPSVTRMSDPNRIHVWFENSEGVADDRPFYLAVFC